jgi:hypothetical protein
MHHSGEYIPIAMLMPAILAILRIFDSASEGSRKKLVATFTQGLINRLSTMTRSEVAQLKETHGTIDMLCAALKHALLHERTETEAQSAIDEITARLRVQMMQPHMISFTNIGYQHNWKEGSPHVAASPAHLLEQPKTQPKVESLQNELTECRRQLTLLHQTIETTALSIPTNAFSQLPSPAPKGVDLPASNHPLVKRLLSLPEGPPHRLCDKQEASHLAALEHLLLQGDVTKAKQLIHWRRELITLAGNNGWEMASLVGRRTVKRLVIQPSDIIKVSEVHAKA